MPDYGKATVKMSIWYYSVFWSYKATGTRLFCNFCDKRGVAKVVINISEIVREGILIKPTSTEWKEVLKRLVHEGLSHNVAVCQDKSCRNKARRKVDKEAYLALLGILMPRDK